jgi:hypothetical protein
MKFKYLTGKTVPLAGFSRANFIGPRVRANRALKLVLLSVLFFAAINLSSQESYFDDIDDSKFISFDISVRSVFPAPSPIDVLFLLDFGLNMGIDIVPDVLSFGMAGDVGIGVDWFLLFADDDDDDDDKKNKTYNQLALSVGTRMYTILKISFFHILPFLGCDFMFIIVPMPYAGVQIKYKMIGIEYARYFHSDDYSMRHQVSFIISIPL